MPLRIEDRAVWIGDEKFLSVGSSGKVRAVHKNSLLVDFGSGQERICQRDKEVITCRQAANRGIEPWNLAYNRPKPSSEKKYNPVRIIP